MVSMVLECSRMELTHTLLLFLLLLQFVLGLILPLLVAYHPVSALLKDRRVPHMPSHLRLLTPPILLPTRVGSLAKVVMGKITMLCQEWVPGLTSLVPPMGLMPSMGDRPLITPLGRKKFSHKQDLTPHLSRSLSQRVGMRCCSVQSLKILWTS